MTPMSRSSSTVDVATDAPEAASRQPKSGELASDADGCPPTTT